MIRLKLIMLSLIAALSGPAVTIARAETPEEWISLGTRVHGGFGAFIPVGIRIGIDALQRLNAGIVTLTS
jgi:hypothetical protein